LKILHVVPTYLPARRYGGPIVAVHGLAKALVARGHDVHVFTTNVDGDGVSQVPLGSAVDVDGVQVHYFASPRPRLYWSPDMRQAFEQNVGGFDVVHSHAVYLWPGVAVARAARAAGVPYVISPRGMLVRDLICRKSSFAKMLWLHLVERRGFARASGIHFTSRLEWEEASRIGLPLPAPFVVPNGVDLEARPDVPRDARTLLYLGRINWKKRLDTAIEALPELHDVRFVIAGNDEENLTPRLRALAAQRGVTDRVDFVGPVYGAAKQQLLARATLLVLLSHSENFGNAVLEALANETPVVLSPGVGLADDVIAANAGVIGLDAIPSLLEDAPRRALLGRNGRKLVEERFAWPRVAEAMENAYRSCLT
jgi:glycosyltransferase involved in cell wall biosynthesis